MTIRSKKIMKLAKGQECTLRLPGCNFNNETTVACHIGMRRGIGIKCGDNMVVFACSDCHILIDKKGKSEFAQDKLRAIEETQEVMFKNGLLKIA